MFESLRQHLIKEIGAHDMEEFVAVAAATATGLPFRQAKSGKQFGGDASAGAVTIEVKTYIQRPPEDERLLGKLSAASKYGTEIWVLVATTAIPSQTHEELTAHGRKLGVHVVVLDWPRGRMPPLLVLIARAHDATLSWLSESRPQLASLVKDALRQICASPDFLEQANALRTDLVPVLASYAATRRAMQASYLAAFSDRQKALRLFRQTLTPLLGNRVVERVKALDRVAGHLAPTSSQEPVVILGDEGVGKTWFVASYWLQRAPNYLFVLIPSKTVSNQSHGDATGLLEDSIATALATARLGQWPPAIGIVSRWCGKPDPSRRMLVVLDGLNEQPSVSWVRVIREMQALLADVGGQLIITCRPRFWHREIGPRVDIPEHRWEPLGGFDDDEFSEALRLARRDPAMFSRELRGDLRNPRIFAIATELLDELKDESTLITKERVLWQYWRHRCKTRDDIVLTDDRFRELLIQHANDAWKEIQSDRGHLRRSPGGRALPTTQEAVAIARGESAEQVIADLIDIADGHFFQSVSSGATVRYAFATDKLWYALGLRLAFMALEAKSSTDDLQRLRELLADLLEPILEMDVAADILSAAFAVSAFVPEMGRRVASLFLLELTDLRNRRNDEDIHNRKRNVLSHVGQATGAYVDAAEVLLKSPPFFDEWVVDGLRRALGMVGAARQPAETAIFRWLDPKNKGVSVDLALRILVGQDFRRFVSALESRRTLDSNGIVSWFDALDDVNNPSSSSTTTRHSQLHRATFETPALQTEPSNEHVEFAISRWRAVAGMRHSKGAWRVPPNLFQRQWNVALAPSLLSWLGATADAGLRTLCGTDLAKSDDGNAFQHLLVARVVGMPVDHRLEFLAQFSTTSESAAPDDTNSFLPDLGPGGADRYLRRVFARLSASSATDDWIGRITFALNFLRNGREFVLNDESQTYLIETILDTSLPPTTRESATVVAARSRGGWVARRLAEIRWSPCNEGILSIATEGSNLIASAAASQGIYPRIRDQIVSPSLLALAVVHESDFRLVVDDIDRLVEDTCAERPSDTRAGEQWQRRYISPLTLEGAHRLGHAAPDLVTKWIRTLTVSFERTGVFNSLTDFAFSLLPGIAIIDRAAAGRFLGHLVDLHVTAGAHKETQDTVEHLRFFRAFSLPSDPNIDLQLERMIRACPDDESLALAVKAAFAGERAAWLRAFAEREIAIRRVARRARARYLSALAGFSSRSISGQSSSFCDAVEDRARVIERDRQAFVGAIEHWQRAQTERKRFQAELTVFDAISGFHLQTPLPLGHGELGELLNSRLSQAVSLAMNRSSQSLFGLQAPPAWMTFGNVPPRCTVPHPLQARVAVQDRE